VAVSDVAVVAETDDVAMANVAADAPAWTVTVRVAGVGSALGCILADFRHDYGQTVLGRFMQFAPDHLERQNGSRAGN
jgi:N-methylhydantoinase A/oxoprolinase/acetone carboxylase beta subunit